jgi:uncharacterized membrane protein YgcG
VVATVPGRAFRNHAVQERKRVSADYPNSILVVVALADRHVEISTSPRHRALFTPTVTKQLLEKSTVPFLRSGRVADGIVAAVNAIADQLMAKPSTARYGGGLTVRQWALKLFLTAIALGIAGFVAFLACRNHICRGCGAWGNYKTRAVQAASAGQNGVKEHVFQCPRCKTNYHWQTSFSYSDTSDSFGSDSSGGGSDGGGGADY